MLKILRFAGRFSAPILSKSSGLGHQTALKFYPLVPPLSIRNISTILCNKHTANSLLESSNLTQTNQETIRTVTKYSWGKGKRKSVKAVLRRFYHLNWGGWIRTICGRNKKLWKKSAKQKRRIRQHVFCNATQSTLLNKMVGKYWTKPRYYVDDPYEPYHTREEFALSAKKPRPYIPPEDRI